MQVTYVEGAYEKGIVYTDQVDKTSLVQIEDLLDVAWMANTHPRFMPDVHAGKGCTIGTTFYISDHICPNLVGVDIGCSVQVEIFSCPKPINFKKLDEIIRTKIPFGSNVHNKPKHTITFEDELWDAVNFVTNKEKSYFKKSVGTLGGGNHAIEVGTLPDGRYTLMVHTGSRNLGTVVANHFQNLAISNDTSAPHKDLAALEKDSKMGQQYLEAVKQTQHYAKDNRQAIIDTIVQAMNFEIEETWESTHNYIDTKTEILRKGAISAEKGEKIAIPLNMRDGVILAIGKGNKEWNYSAPHGAGRLLSRRQAKKKIPLNRYKEQMEGIWSTSVTSKTLDEAPDAYKDSETIIEALKPTADIQYISTPIYNFKA